MATRQKPKQQEQVPRRKQGGKFNREPHPDKGLAGCLACGAYFYNKKWYSEEQLFDHMKNSEQVNSKKGFQAWLADELPKVKWQVCLADKQKKSWAEGVVTITNINMDQKNDLLNLIRNINKRHVKRDIQDRIIAMDDKSDKVVVYTSENVLAQVIGKQVARAFKGGELDILFSHNEDAVRVSYQFK